jgi:hypothetical protein
VQKTVLGVAATYRLYASCTNPVRTEWELCGLIDSRWTRKAKPVRKRGNPQAREGR